MASNSLSLPVDIPWERWCVSEDMIDNEACDRDRPAKWQSSIAAFKYVPEDDYQVYPGRKITYLKVVCTISGYQPKVNEIQGVLANLAGITTKGIDQGELETNLAAYKPCHEAIIQVTVAPPRESGIPLDEYPYIMDFQPKKRELFEVGTESNEYMSRSLESLNIRKSSGTTDSQEVLDIDQGFNVGLKGEYQGVGVSGQYGQTGQWGTKHVGTGESGVARTTDESRERRETVSHTTQITHLRHLLDSYHLGTNRAVFFVQPRPNVHQEPSGFVSGPRPIEGIQEFFLIVNQPKDQQDFCVDIRLDTGHIYEEPVMDYVHSTDTAECTVSANAPSEKEGEVEDKKWKRYSVNITIAGAKIELYGADIRYNCIKLTKFPEQTIYKPPNAANRIDEFHVLSSNISGDASLQAEVSQDGETLIFTGYATGRASVKAPLALSDSIQNEWPSADPVTAGLIWGAAPGSLPEDSKSSSATLRVEVNLVSRQPTVDTGKKKKTFFITTRGLCSCKEKAKKPGDGEVNEGFVYEGSLPIWEGTENVTIVELKQLEAAMRNEMLQSLVSPRRTAPRPFINTKMVTALVLPTILQNPVARIYMSQPSADAIPATLAKSLPESFRNNLKQISRLDLLTLNTPVLARISGLDEASVHELKVAMLTEPFKAPTVAMQPNAVQQPEEKSSKQATSKPRVPVKQRRRKSSE